MATALTVIWSPSLAVPVTVTLIVLALLSMSPGSTLTSVMSSPLTLVTVADFTVLSLLRVSGMEITEISRTSPSST